MRLFYALLSTVILLSSCIAQDGGDDLQVSRAPESLLPNATYRLGGFDESPSGAAAKPLTWIEIPKGVATDLIEDNLHPTLVIAEDGKSFTIDPDGAGPEDPIVVPVGTTSTFATAVGDNSSFTHDPDGGGPSPGVLVWMPTISVDGNGDLIWDRDGGGPIAADAPISVGGDDLGDHTATQDLDLNGNDIVGLGALVNDNALTDILVRDASGNVKSRAASSLGGGGSDDLGDHTATQDLDLNGNDIIGLGALVNDDALTQVLVRDATGALKYRTAASIAGVGGATSGLIDFAEQGGVEGSGATTLQREANWDLLKTLETSQDTNDLEIFITGGDWYFQPEIDPDDNIGDPWGVDHIEADSGTTILRGAGKDATVLHFPNRWSYYIFRQRAWDNALIISSLTITVDGQHTDTFTADASTDKLTATAHGFVSDNQYMKFTSSGTLPDPLGDDTQNSKDRVSPVVADANSFYVKDWLSNEQTFTLDAGADTVNIVGHGKSNGDLIVPITAGSLAGTGIANATRYFVVGASTDTYQLSLTFGGAAIDITGAGTGTHKAHEVIDLTDAGTGTHTLYEIGDRSVITAGYSIGASSGIDSSDGTNEFNVFYDNVRFIGISVYNSSSSKGAKNLTMKNCEVFDTAGVAITAFINDTGTEGVDWRRPHIQIDGCRFEERADSKPPFGNHFYYGHPTAHQRVTNSTFINCWNIAVQIQSESSTGGAGEQLIANNYFQNNEKHIITAQAQDDRGRAMITGNTFDGTGNVEFRSDTVFTSNIMRSTTTPMLTLTDAGGDDNERKETYLVANNTFIVAGVAGTNAVCAFVKDGALICKFIGNIWRRDPLLSAGTQIFLGNFGSTLGDTLGEFYFINETYSFETTGSAVGPFLYPASFYEFKGIRQDGPEALFLTAANSGGTEVRINDCVMDFEDASGDNQKATMFINHTGWTITGRNNKFRDASWIDNPAGLTGYLEFGEGRDTAGITAASTVYIDPSFDEFVISGTTTIDNIEIGVTGNIAPHADSDNAEDLWTGTIRVKVPDTLTLSGSGNIANGPYTATGAEVLELFWDNGTWIINE